MKQYLLLFLLIFSINCSVFSQSDVKSIVRIGNDLVKLDRYAEALEKFDEALDYLPSFAPAIDGKANLLILMEDYKKASKIIEEAIKRNSDYPQFYLTKGIINIKKNKYEDAVEDLGIALDLAQGLDDKVLESKIYANRGAAYQKLLENEAALNDYSKAIQLDGNNPNVYLYRGFLYYQNNDHPEALKDFDSVIEIDPKNPFAYYNRGMINFKQDKILEACDDFHKACELGNNNACKMVINHCITIRAQ
ncbi:MAG: tetratricopeptide repeat protein [Bacteroidales bacterium]|nr:tetratricopeptide repeat protein [Bacteroidales bacterium]